VNGIQEAVAGAIKKFTTFGFWDSRKRAKGGRELTTIDPFAIATHIQNMFVVTKFAASHDAMEFFSRPVSLGVGGISRVTWSDGRERRTRMVKEFNRFLWWQSREKSRRWKGVDGEVSRSYRT
jgi:hypothetical protein